MSRRGRALIIIMFLFVCSANMGKENSFESSNEEAIKLLRLKENKKNEARKELNSIEDSSLSETEHEINYSVTFPLEESVENESDVSMCSDDSGSVDYNIKYIKDANLMFIDSTINENGSIEKNKYYGFPFINDNGDVDVNYNFDGTSISFSSIPTISIDKGPIDILPQTPKIYDLMSIGVKIADLNEAKVAALGNEESPDLLEDGPTRYMLFWAKINMIEENYDNNAAQEQPNGLITDQLTSRYKNWKFGLKFERNSSSFISENGTIYTNGCGCIALYNMLYQSGADPYLPALIAFIQLKNADLVMGAFGVNPLDDAAITTLKAGLNLFYNMFLVPLMHVMVPTLTEIIHVDFLAKNPGWLVVELLLPGTGEITKLMISSALEAAIVATAALELFAELYLDSLTTFPDLMEIYSQGEYSPISCISYKTLISNMMEYSQGIITFWVSDNINDGAHTIYVQRTTHIGLTAYNFSGVYPTKIILSQNDPITTESRYIYGYVWRKSL